MRSKLRVIVNESLRASPSDDPMRPMIDEFMAYAVPKVPNWKRDSSSAADLKCWAVLQTMWNRWWRDQGIETPELDDAYEAEIF